MKNFYKIFVINPGTTSTKLALFQDENKIYETNVFHEASELLSYPTVNAQLPYRKKVILDFLQEEKIDLSDVDAIVGRGGSCYPVSGGVYEVDDLLLEDTKACRGGMEHPSNLGIQLGVELQREYGGRVFMLDPIATDELCDEARMTGIYGLNRHVNLHTLNCRGIAMKYAKSLGKQYSEMRLIVAHIDGGITISAHCDGKIIDCNDSGGGDGPYTPTRVGSVSVADLIDYCQGKTPEELHKLCNRTGGFVSHFGTNDASKVHNLVEQGNPHAVRVWNGMIYQVNKYIGALAAVLEGKVDAICLTGGLLRYPDLVENIRSHCGWIAPIALFPGEVEHEAMAAGALRVLRGEELPRKYSGHPVWEGWPDEK